MPQPRLGVVGFQPSIDTSYSLGKEASIEAKEEIRRFLERR